MAFCITHARVSRSVNTQVSKCALPGCSNAHGIYRIYFGTMNCNCRRMLESPTMSGFSTL